jgi:Helix-turn-helix domain
VWMSAEDFQPRDFRRSLRGAGLTDAEYRVAVELCEFAGIGRPVVWPSMPVLAENCCMSDRRNVRRILHRLETKGVIVCIARSKGGRGQTSRWELRTATQETGSHGTPFTDNKTGSHEPQNWVPTRHKTGSHGTPEVVIEVDKEVARTRATYPPADPIPEEPPRFCDDHMPNGSAGEKCRACGDARVAHDAWEEVVQVIRVRQRKARRAAIDACPHCDDNGMAETDYGFKRCECNIQWRKDDPAA